MRKARRQRPPQRAGDDGAALASEPRVRMKVRDYEDVADSEDEFHLNQDKILLEEEDGGPAAKRLKRLQKDDAFFEPSDDEILPLPDSESEIDASEELEDDDGDEEGEAEIEDYKNAAQSGKRSRDQGDSLEEDEGLAGWGDSRRDYYGADPIETEADAREEEKEALRLQKRQLQGMAMEDYGLDDEDWLRGEDEVEEPQTYSAVVQEILPELDLSQDLSEEQVEKIFATRYPEFARLSQTFLGLQAEYESLDGSIAKATRTEGDGPMANTINLSSLLLKRNALGAYLGTLAMYFAILTSGSKSTSGHIQARSPSDMRMHPVIEALVKTQAMWEEIRDISFPEPRSTIENQLPLSAQQPQEEGSSLETNVSRPVVTKPKKAKKPSKEVAASEAKSIVSEAAVRRAERVKRVEEELATLSASVAKPKSSREAGRVPDLRQDSNGSDSNSDFGEIDALTAEEAEDKARRRRGLRFHTSKLTAKSVKRDRAVREGGDADIPYRERLRDRQARLNTAAEARGAANDPSTELHADTDSGDENDNTREAFNDEEEDYYDLVAAQARRKKEDRAANAVAHKNARITGRVAESGDAVGPDGKRVITYAIEKNKGLTPKRKKEGRNPRVKKRNKYEEKKKKLNSMRPVYKGGEGRGGYAGEKTGIRKNIVKSIKL